MNTNVSINTNFKYICAYCLQYVCMCMSVCIMFASVKFHVTNRRCLTLWEITELRISCMAPLLSVVQTVVVPWASSRRQLVGRGVSQSALVHPNRWSGEGSSQAPCDKGTQARGGCHIPGKPLWRKNCDDKPAVTARDAFHACVPARAIRKVFGSAAHIVVPAWLGQGVLASTDRRKKINPQYANHSTVLLSAWWLNPRLLINIFLLTEPGKRSQQNAIWKLVEREKGSSFIALKIALYNTLKNVKSSKWSVWNSLFIYLFI